MGNPLIVYDRPLLNPSFELGTLGTLPTSWTVSGNGTGIREVSETDFFPRGSKEGKRSLKLRADTLDFGVSQRALNWYHLNQTIRLTAWARNLDAGNVTVRLGITDENAAFTFLGSSALDFAIGSAWTLMVLERLQDQATGVHTLPFIHARLGEAKNFLVDYVQFGRQVDFDRNFLDFDADEVSRRQLSLGSGAYEAVKLADAITRLKGNFGSVDEGSALDLQIHKFRGWAEAHRSFAFWLDRDVAKNQDLHFGDCIGSEEFPRALRSGPRRYRWMFEAVAPKEWIAQA